jgi:crossover junction endodeoxyribonuclease RuvC
MTLQPGGGLVVIGLDPGSRCTGYGVVREVSGRLTLLEAGTVRPRLDDPLSVRLGHIYKCLCELIYKFGPDEAAVEDVFVSANPGSALKLGQARGAAIVACATGSVPVFSYEPARVKKSLVGVGRAQKDQVAYMVGQLLGLKPVWASDASDAIAVAICHLNERRFRRLSGAL